MGQPGGIAISTFRITFASKASRNLPTTPNNVSHWIRKLLEDEWTILRGIGDSRRPALSTAKNPGREYRTELCVSTELSKSTLEAFY